MLLTSADIAALILTLKLATVSTAILLIIGLPIAWWLARTRSRIKPLIETLIALPLILPPTVIGFYLLLAFSPDNWFASSWQQLFGTSLAFSFSGLVIGSVIYSLPFVVQPMQSSYEKIPQLTLLTAASLGANKLDQCFSILLPMTRRATIAAACLAFAHTIGEVGVVLMIGGNIPGETQVISIALYDHVESLAYDRAHTLALTLLIFSFVSLLIIYAIGRRGNNKSNRTPLGIRHA
jgi:molybdate transport system permease protein